MKKIIISLVAFFMISSLSNSYALDLYSLDQISTRGQITNENPFGGSIIWTQIEGEDGVIVATSDHGIVTIRFNVQQIDTCIDSPNLVCLVAIITETKNALRVSEGDRAEMVFDMPYRQTITVLDGELASLILELDLQSVKYRDPFKQINKKVLHETDPVKKAAWTKFQSTLALTEGQLIREELNKSLMIFESYAEIKSIIKTRDLEWTSVSKDEITPFMMQLIESDTSKFLRKVIEEDKQKEQIFVISEIILTNSLGANVAQTGKTTDYDQSDEDWWQQAKINGIYLDVGYDESVDAMSADTSMRIIDDQGRFLGVVKIVVTQNESIPLIQKND